eukprot:TRINITY_DN18014_c0_g1_i1.p1 TRINITY_DN18014_c0_g1~~TRINITY_DN18014_c0_g1_i1.p1  ORF type:complete len:268 (-),score=30.65 TRINITY_DN18014_c0_g1_i1:30-833(-)
MKRLLRHVSAYGQGVRGLRRKKVRGNLLFGTTTSRGIKYLTQKEAISVDIALMSKEGFSIDQLMELAGLSVAEATLKEFPIETHPRVLVVSGPGNNGGDGLVAARHLSHFRYEKVHVCYPVRKDDENHLYSRLQKQCERVGVSFCSSFPDDTTQQFDLLIDAMFGFSFNGATVREPFATALQKFQASILPYVAVDIPSGWSVEKGAIYPFSIRTPDVLVSLTAPKLFAKKLQHQRHYIGGRFVPHALASAYQLDLPIYPSSSQTVLL